MTPEGVVLGARWKPPRSWPSVALVAIGVLALAIGIWLRASLLGNGSLWLDELWTLDAVSRSFKEMIGARLLGDVHPPLWSMVAWAWLRLTGTYAEPDLRVLSLAFGVIAAAAPLIAATWLTRLRPALVVMAVLTSLSLFTVQYSAEFRSYSMMLALGTVATLIWAGLLVGDIRADRRRILAFAFFGALTGFSHYYGLLLYVGELGVLFGWWAVRKRGRPLVALVASAAVSFVPVVAWLILARGKMPLVSVAGPPTIATVEGFLAYAFAPLTNMVAGHDLGYAYADGAFGIEAKLFVAMTLALSLAAVVRAMTHRQVLPATFVGLASVVIVVGGVAASWAASIILPPSMNVRNLAALLPPLFLAAGCALIPFASANRNAFVAATAASVLVVITLSTVAASGLPALTPPWHAQAGYRDVARTLVTDAEAPGTALIGVELPWGWHGEWDAAIRAEQGARPAESADKQPLPVRWVLSVDELKATGLPASRLVVFSDSSDDRTEAALSWIQQERPACARSSAGGPGFGHVSVLTCPPAESSLDVVHVTTVAAYAQAGGAWRMTYLMRGLG